MLSKKAQSGIEFIILVGFLLFSFTIFFLIIQGNLSDKFSERRNIEIKEIALTIKNEIDLAFHSSDGYKREFKIPSSVYGKNYDATIDEDIIYVRTTDGKHAISFATKKVSGQIVKFENLITKENGEVKLNV